MKKIIYLILVFLIFLSLNTAFGFAGMARNNSSNEAAQLTDTIESDRDIVLLQHLIEIDTVRFQAENRLYVKETLIFKNIGTKNFSGTLRTWVPDGIEGISVGKIAMVAGSGITPVQAVQNGNIVSWSAEMEINALPPMFSVEYVQTAEPKGALSRGQTYSKKFTYPTLINYRYQDRPDLPAVVIKVTKLEDSTITFTDENGNKISTQDVSEDGNSIISRFSSPAFKELTIEVSKSKVTASGIMGYVILGILILIVFSYPVLRKKSEKLQAFEEKLKNSLKREEESEEEPGKEITEEVVEEEPGEEITEEAVEVEPGEEEDISGKSKDELEIEKNRVLSKLDELEKDYSSGNLLDEEYEELKGTYKAKIKEIDKNLKQSK